MIQHANDLFQRRSSVASRYQPVIGLLSASFSHSDESDMAELLAQMTFGVDVYTCRAWRNYNSAQCVFLSLCARAVVAVANPE